MFKVALSSILILSVSSFSFADLDRDTVCRSYSPAISKSECRALVDFYNATGGDNWKNNSGWGSSNISSWFGLELYQYGSVHHVASISLGGNNLDGEMPDVLSAWPELDRLILHDNKLSGELPASFYSATKIQHVNLSGNKLKGSLSRNISRLRNLLYLTLGSNEFSGSIPKEVFELPNAEAIWLSDNDFSGSLGAVTKISSSIRSLSLRDNKLSGKLPMSLFLSRDLEDLYLSNNYFSGEIPRQIGQAVSLKVFEAGRNRLSGIIPNEIGLIRNLEYLNLSENSLSGILPSELSKARVLERLDLSKNNFQGPLPESYGDLSFLEFLSLHSNRLTGSLPVSWKNLSSLSYLTLSENFLSGELLLESIPDGNLLSLSLRDNRLSGHFPMEILGEDKISDVDIRNNFFSNDFDTTKPAQGPLFQYQTRPPSKMLGFDAVQYTVNSNDEAAYIALPSADGHGGVVFPVSMNGRRLEKVSGCEGIKKGGAYVLPVGASACEVSLEFVDCELGDGSCRVPVETSEGVRLFAIESPVKEKVLSGVSQLRGWNYDREYVDYLAIDYNLNKEQRMKLVIDGDISLDVAAYQYRGDVISGLGVNKTSDFIGHLGWDVLLNSALLSNGKHVASLVSVTGAVLDEVEFTVFNPELESGNAGFINQNFPDAWVEDFPFDGSSVKLSFNISEQRFSIVDQEINGASTRGDQNFFTDDGLVHETVRKYKGLPGIHIEYPSSSAPLTGVASIRGWDVEASGETGRTNFGYEFRIDNNVQLFPKADDRPDIKSALDIYYSNSGRSSLIYSGLLKNGFHRLRYQRNSGSLRLLAEVIFESFSPLNENGDQQYITGVEKSLRYSDFPFSGSDVELSFDQASQSFVVSKQWVNGVKVN
ncbi:hypothetical protein [uncultured Pseudoteredinibacter sp.]|uniref:hypothetical protein n=1 Tax=uncultured Pseudoteredinibacter sp. TaxID=1641701 RepID=UPI0026311A24|nr:hypothetical protein [uncultured Pseudoteredinibacter sp.]